MSSILFNHLIRLPYHKKCSIINFLKITDKISEICILKDFHIDRISDSLDLNKKNMAKQSGLFEITKL